MSLLAATDTPQFDHKLHDDVAVIIADALFSLGRRRLQDFRYVDWAIGRNTKILDLQAKHLTAADVTIIEPFFLIIEPFFFF